MKIKAHTGLEQSEYDKIVQIAEKKYDGNFSLALRKIILSGLDDYKLKQSDTFFADSLPQAMHVLTYQLRCDEDYKQSWVANIAMAFQDTFRNYMGTRGRNEAIDALHAISNDAAKSFISNLTQTNGGN